LTLFELLRHRFLSEARAVAFLDISDLLLPVPEGSVFDRAAQAPGKVLPLKGVETYPWRLRQGRPAPHSDHIAQRRNERRWLVSWAAAPSGLPPEATWKPGRPYGVPALEGPVAPFRRAMGVTFPGVPVNKLVRKADLREDPQLLELMETAFDAAPIRLPAPGKIPPRPATASVTVISTMKNEGPFILDWIAHNRAIGIDRHLVYTNDCDDGTDRLLDLLSEAGVTRRDNPYRASGKVPQHAAFRSAEGEDAVTGADWLITLDIDEYINIHIGKGRIADLLAAVPDAHVLSMPWRLFGNADIHSFTDNPVTEQFTRCAPAYAPRPLQAWAFKSLFRNAGLFRRLGVHRPKGLETSHHAGLKWVDGAGRELPPAVWRAAWRMSKAHWGYDLVTLNHYAVRSAESFLVKRDRGRVNHTTRDQGEPYWFRMNHNAEEDLSIQRLAPGAAAEKAAMLALPGVAKAHAEAVTWHNKRIAELREHPDHAALYASITSPRMEHLSRMATYFGSNVFLAGPHVIPDDIAARAPEPPFFFTVGTEPG
ncbi:MAG: glycosyltransferase family 2 protein, partial [Alphaproteobacteria bacterium]|nr:glycosyltransferase family 2 protein [Alphaproteobacteria bacterium]